MSGSAYHLHALVRACLVAIPVRTDCACYFILHDQSRGRRGQGAPRPVSAGIGQGTLPLSSTTTAATASLLTRFSWEQELSSLVHMWPLEAQPPYEPGPPPSDGHDDTGSDDEADSGNAPAAATGSVLDELLVGADQHT